MVVNAATIMQSAGKAGAFAMASVVAMLVAAVIYFLWMAPSLSNSFSLSTLTILLFSSIFMGVLFIPFILLVCIPSTLVLARFQMLNYWAMAAIGLVVPCAVAALFLINFPLGFEDKLLLAMMGSQGMGTALVFLAVWRYFHRKGGHATGKSLP
ncbi:MAG: hypothetical protein ACREP4_13105 [Stenotrophomonas sp.]|uniref:hypothetical protein n=1 Tax=Stenotrophomonas sp. TaxID=69392 RepID=UPI003D6CE74F